MLEGVKRNENDDQYVKLILTGGVSADGITPGQPSFLGIFQKAGTGLYSHRVLAFPVVCVRV